VLIAGSVVFCVGCQGPATVTPARTITFETGQIVGMRPDLDLSPDGRAFVFSLFGDLYALPVTGGEATQLTRGLPWDASPVWSSDGRQIAFLSDATGAGAIWVMSAHGSERRKVTRERPVVPYGRWPSGEALQAAYRNEFLGVLGPSLTLRWLPDGRAIVAGDSVYQISDGAAAPIDNVPSGAVQFSRDGRYAYGDRDGEIVRYDRATGATRPVARLPADSWGPLGCRICNAPTYQLSSDGQWLLYVPRYNQITQLDGDAEVELRLRSLETGEDRPLVRGMKARMLGSVRRYFFTPDSRAVLLVENGHIDRIDAATGARQSFPFTVRVQVDAAELLRPPARRVTNDSLLTVRFLRWPAVSPDRRTLVFVALERLYTMPLSGGAPQRLVAEEVEQLHPVYSPDGRWVAYVTWSDTAGGHLWRVPAGGGPPERLTTVPARYQWPAWSPDGTLLAVLNGGPKDLGRFRDDDPADTALLQVLPSRGGPVRTVTERVLNAAPVTFTPDGRRLLLHEAPGDSEGRDTLVSVDLEGRDRRVIARMADIAHDLGPWYSLPRIFPSPDGRYVAYFDELDLYLAPLAGDASEPVPLGHSLGRGPIVRLAPGMDPRWDPDSKMLTWVSGPLVYRIEPERALAEAYGPVARTAVAGAVPPWAMPQHEIPVNLAVPRRLTRGTLALRGARVVTMRGDEVIERGTIVITNDRITAIGPAASVQIPRGATVIDLTGKTIVPGLIDMHAHFYSEQHLLADFAFGVTTTREVGGPPSKLGWGERIQTGDLIGPRYMGVGQQLGTFSARLESLEDVRLYAQHFKRLGAALLKMRYHDTRRGRQWGVLVAREVGLPITGHHEIGKAWDGYSGLEHIPADHRSGPTPDWPRMAAELGLWLAPTWASSASTYFDGSRWCHDPRLRRFTPPRFISGTFGSPQFERICKLTRDDPNSDAAFLWQVRSAAEIVRRGGNVTPASHGDYAGIGMHWGLWGMVEGGLTPHEALRTVTLTPAEGLGVEQDLGSLEVGKLADLLVLDKNPLEDIQHTLSIRYVMKNGELYDGETMATIWPERIDSTSRRR
jgi:Tol biopolymer transport system component